MARVTGCLSEALLFRSWRCGGTRQPDGDEVQDGTRRVNSETGGRGFLCDRDGYRVGDSGNPRDGYPRPSRPHIHGFEQEIRPARRIYPDTQPGGCACNQEYTEHTECNGIPVVAGDQGRPKRKNGQRKQIGNVEPDEGPVGSLDQ